MPTLHLGTNGDDGLTPVLENGDTVHGAGGNDVIFIEETLDAGLAVSLAGGDGDDWMWLPYFNGADVKWFGGEGTDFVQLAAGNFSPDLSIDMRAQTKSIERLETGSGDDTIFGTVHGETISGGTGFNRVRGGGGDDYLESGQGFVLGGRGDDTLYGDGNSRFEAATLVGGEGEDIFVFRNDPRRQGKILDFTSGEDAIDLTEYSGDDGPVDLQLVEKGNKVLVRDGEDVITRLEGLTLDQVSIDDILIPPL